MADIALAAQANRRVFFALLIAVFALIYCLPSSVLAAEVTSPDGRIEVVLDADGEGIPSYSISRDGEEIISKSNLGFNFTDSDPMRRGFEVIDEARSAASSKWEQPWGERQWVQDKHNELALTFRQKDEAARQVTVRMRVFNDGVGFRYEFPDQAGLPVANIAGELTEFNIAQNGEALWIPAGDWNRYEYLYHKTPLSAVSTAHTPITMVLDDGTHIAFHEAALVDYSGMWLRRMDERRFRAQLAPSSRGAKVVRKGAFNTPWRTIRISDGPQGLFASDIDLNLNEPNKLGDVSWFTPHKYIGIWWEMHLDDNSWASGPKHGATTERAKSHIDFAAANGFRGVLIEGWNKGWDGNWFGNGREFSFTEAYPDFDIEEVTRYGREKGVRLIGHHETGGNLKVYEAQLEDAMALYERLGIDAVKTGYVADAGGLIAAPQPGTEAAAEGKAEVFEWHDGQVAVQHHQKVVEIAAKHKIAVNPHEPVKDTGLRRTYPNWVSREGARGMEYQAWGVPPNLPDHVPNLVYTRMLSGPMDYTPGVLSLKGRGGRDLQSTLARQLALYVVLYSPIQMAADLPENLAQYPRELAFIRQVPADWAQSKLLSGKVGEYAVMARKDRNSDAWYIGGVTDDTPREAKLDLSFLEPGKTYTATLYRDGKGADGIVGEDGKDTRHQIAIESRTLRAGDTLTIPIARAGGFAIALVPESK